MSDDTPTPMPDAGRRAWRSSWAPATTGKPCSTRLIGWPTSACRSSGALSRRTARPTCSSTTPNRPRAAAFRSSSPGPAARPTCRGCVPPRPPAGPRRAGRVGGPARRRFAPVDRSDACGDPGWDSRHWQGGGVQRRPLRDRHPGHSRYGLREKLKQWRARQTQAVLEQSDPQSG